MGLRMYDVSIDDYRDVTQVDIDKYQAVANAYGRLRIAVDTIHAELQAESVKIASRAGKPNDMMVDNDRVTGDL